VLRCVALLPVCLHSYLDQARFVLPGGNQAPSQVAIASGERDKVQEWILQLKETRIVRDSRSSRSGPVKNNT